MLAGGLSAGEVSQDVKDLVNHNTANINAKLGTHATSFTVNSVHSQVVAGTNYFLHLTSNDGHKYSVVIYVPLPHTGAPASVTFAENGHTQPRNPH